MTQMTFDEILTTQPDAEGDDTVNDPDDAEKLTEDDLEDAEDHGDDDDDDE